MAAWVDNLLAWFEANRRPMPWRDDPSPYKVWISEVMLQQTQVATVIPYFERFVRRFPDVEHLAGAQTGDVLKLWEGLGYYSRARRLPDAARRIVAAGGFPRSAAAWREIPGVGDYTAAAIASIAGGEAVPSVDGNVLRVVARFRGIRQPVTTPAVRVAIRDFLAPRIRKANPSVFNQAMMELGALVCRPAAPRCGECPLRAACVARRKALTGVIPCKAAATAVPHRTGTAVILRRGDGCVLVCRRPEHGLLGGLWEFPGGLREEREPLPASMRRAVAERTGLAVGRLRRRGRIEHAFSHFTHTIHVFEGRVEDPACTPPAGMRWASPEDIATLPFSKAQRRIAGLATPPGT